MILLVSWIVPCGTGCCRGALKRWRRKCGLARTYDDVAAVLSTFCESVHAGLAAQVCLRSPAQTTSTYKYLPVPVCVRYPETLCRHTGLSSECKHGIVR